MLSRKKIISIAAIIFLVFFIFSYIGKSHMGTFKVSGGNVYVYHLMLHGLEKFKMQGIDGHSFSAYNDAFFKDTNGIYLRIGFKGNYQKLEVDRESFASYRDDLMQDKNCFYERNVCIPKSGESENIQIFIDNNLETSEIHVGHKNPIISFDYTGEKTPTTVSFYSGDGTITGSVLDENDTYPIERYTVYDTPGTYEILIVLGFENNEYEYATKTITVTP